MNGGIVVDIIIILLALLFAINGHRQGFIVGSLTFAGFFGGALLGVRLAPVIVELSREPLARVILALATVFGIALFGQWLASALGLRLRKKIKRRGARRLDEAGGTLVSILAVLLVAWMVAAPLASSGLPGVSAAVRNSAIVGAVDETMPAPIRGIYEALRDSVNTNGFPDVFAGLDPSDIQPVEPPDPELAASAVVQAAQVSVLKVSGDAPQCDRHIEGSSFVFDHELVMTNAHVVAGTDTVSVATEDGQLEAHVIVYDPQRDLAVLWVPGLTAPPLPLTDSPAQQGENTIVLGFPQGGPYTATPSRIREERNVTGPNIYNSSDVTREVYSLRARVISGNSGGPLLSEAGEVYGVIFAAAVDDDETGYALTMSEVFPVMDQGRAASGAVSTQGCS